MISIKTPEDIEQMRHSCQLAAQALVMIQPYIVPGVTTDRLNTLCHQYILDHKATPSPLNYRPTAQHPLGFPKSICTSVNHQVCHGIPGPRVLREGDIINVDITTYYRSFHGDTSKTFFVGKSKPKGDKIVRIAQECLELGIRAALPNRCIHDIGSVIQRHAHKNRCSVVREYCGHGIGREFHEPPTVLHYATQDQGPILKPGMTFTIEPMINLGKAAIKQMSDGWTVVTKDRSLSAQFEHTILITEDGNEILTKPKEP